jgi:hypothetical protein
MGISSINMSFILKSIVKVERSIIVKFILSDQFLMSLKLIIIES